MWYIYGVDYLLKEEEEEEVIFILYFFGVMIGEDNRSVVYNFIYLKVMPIIIIQVHW